MKAQRSNCDIIMNLGQNKQIESIKKAGYRPLRINVPGAISSRGY